jgi:hypothetical protein
MSIAAHESNILRHEPVSLGEWIDVVKHEFVCILELSISTSDEYCVFVSCVFYLGQLNLGM